MAESLNTMADHRATFVAWWKASMDEAIALRELHEAETTCDRDEALQELRTAAHAKMRQINAIRSQIAQFNQRMLDTAQRLKSGRHGSAIAAEAEILENSAQQVATLLEVVHKEGGD
jgi:methyl-accepting chemotaxis protein